MKNADLHTHSYYSDGEFSPKQIIKKAKKLKIKYLALTDHNSVEGVQQAINEGKKQGITIISATELKVKQGEVLAYFIDSKNKNLQKQLQKFSHSKKLRVRERIKVLKKAGLDISFSKFIKEFPHSKNNYETGNLRYYFHNLLKISGKEYLSWLNKIKIKKIKSTNPTIIQGIKFIKKYGGIPVFAHPWISEYMGEFKFTDRNIKKLVKAGLKGIEIDNNEGYRYGRTPKFVKKIRKFAKKYDLILTSGSDYHGECFLQIFGKHHLLGKSNCDEKIVQKLKNLKENGQK